HSARHHRVVSGQLRRVWRLGSAPRVGQIEGALGPRSLGIHAAAISDLVAVVHQHLPDVPVPRLWSVSEMEYAMLPVTQAGMERIPLDPRLEVVRIAFLCDGREHGRPIGEVLEMW